MEKKTEVWICRADVCALLGAKRLYASLPPGQDRLRAFFQTLSLQKFRDALRANCFQGDDATEHVLVTVDPEVLLVLRAMGLCGTSDEEGRPVCFLGEGSKKWYNPMSRTASTLADEQLGRIEPILSQAYQMLTLGRPPAEDEKILGYIKVSVWHMIKNLYREVGEGQKRQGHLFYGPNQTSLTNLVKSSQDLATQIAGAKNSFATFLQKEAGCTTTVSAAWGGSCKSNMDDYKKKITTYFLRVALASVLFVFDDRDWTDASNNWVEKAFGGENLQKTFDGGIRINDLHLLYSKDGDGVLALSARVSADKSAYTLGAPPDTVIRKTFLSSDLQDLKGKFQASPLASAPRTNRAPASHESLHLAPQTLLLCQTLYLQFAVLFPAAHLRDKTPHDSEGLKNPTTALLVQRTLQDLFPTAGTLLPLLRKVSQNDFLIHNTSGTSSFNADFSPTAKELLQALLADLGAHPVVDAVRKQHQKDSQKILTFFTQRLLEAVLMERLRAQEGDTSVIPGGLLEAARDAQLSFLSFLPLTWDAKEKLLYATVRELNGNTAVLGPDYTYGLPKDLDFARRQALQTEISTFLREHSALGKGVHLSHYDPESCLEAFRPSNGTYNTRRFGAIVAVDPSALFSQEYLNLLQEVQKEEGNPWIVTQTRNVHTQYKTNTYTLAETIGWMIEELQKELTEHSKWHDGGAYSFEFTFQIPDDHDKNNVHEVTLSPSGSSDISILGPMLRWMLATSHAPNSATHVAGILVVDGKPIPGSLLRVDLLP